MLFLSLMLYTIDILVAIVLLLTLISQRRYDDLVVPLLIQYEQFQLLLLLAHTD